MERLIFEDKGLPNKNRFLAFGILCLLFDILCFISVYKIKIPVKMIVGGVLLAVSGISFIRNAIVANKSYIKIFSEHIEGLYPSGHVALRFFIINKNFSIEFHNISHVEFLDLSSAVKISWHGGGVIMSLKNAAHVAEIITEKMNGLRG